MSEAGKSLEDGKEDRAMLELEKLDLYLREAQAWRMRIRGPNAHIKDCDKNEILIHFDEAIRAAVDYRAKMAEKDVADIIQAKLIVSECNRRYREAKRKKILAYRVNM